MLGRLQEGSERLIMTYAKGWPLINYLLSEARGWRQLELWYQTEGFKDLRRL